MNKLLTNSIKIFIGGMAIFLISIWFICNSFLKDICFNTIYMELESPDHKNKAILFERNCGATTGFSTQISIKKFKKKLKNTEKGNIFIADDDHGKAPPGITGGSPVKIIWINNDSIQIEYHPKTRIFKNIAKYKSIKIGYILNDNLE